MPGAFALAGLAWRDARGDPARGRAAAGPAESPPPAPFLFPLGWFVTGFVFFSVSTGKRAAYLLPLYPAAALLVGWVWAEAMAKGRGSRWLGVPVALLAGIAAVLALAVVLVPRHLIPGRMVDTLVPAERAWQVAAATILLTGAATLWLELAARAARGDVRGDRRRIGALLPRRRARPRPSIRGAIPGARAGGTLRRPRATRRARALASGGHNFLVAFDLDRGITPVPAPPSSSRRAGPRRASRSSTTTTARCSGRPASPSSRRAGSGRSGSSSSGWHLIPVL